MAEKAAYSLKSNATRLGQRLGENIAGKSHDPWILSLKERKKCWIQ